MPEDDDRENVDIESIFGKPGNQWTSTEKAIIACWLATERRKQYLTIGWLVLGNRDDAEEAFQEFCIQIMVKGVPKFDPQEGPAGAYIRQAWRNFLRNQYKRQRRHDKKEQQMPLDSEGMPVVEATDSYLSVPILADIELRLATLADEERAVLELRFFNSVLGFNSPPLAAFRLEVLFDTSWACPEEFH